MLLAVIIRDTRDDIARYDPPGAGLMTRQKIDWLITYPYSRFSFAVAASSRYYSTTTPIWLHVLGGLPFPHVYKIVIVGAAEPIIIVRNATVATPGGVELISMRWTAMWGPLSFYPTQMTSVSLSLETDQAADASMLSVMESKQTEENLRHANEA